MRSGVIDENNVILAGNGTVEEAGQIGIENIIIVEGLTGNEVVMVQRTGLTEEQKKRYAIADNTASDFSTWNPEILAEIVQEVDLDGFFPDDRLEEVLRSLGNQSMPTDSDWGSAIDKLPSEDRQPYQQMTFTLHDDQVETVKSALEIAKKNDFSDTENENSNGNALNFICEYFLNHVR